MRELPEPDTFLTCFGVLSERSPESGQGGRIESWIFSNRDAENQRSYRCGRPYRGCGTSSFFIGVAAALFILSFAVRVTRIEAGHVGVEINLAGRQRGASEIPVRTGWVCLFTPHYSDHRISHLRANRKWTRDTNEGHPINEEMGFNSKEGMEIFVDVSLSYAIDPSKAPDFYVKYRVDDLDRFTHGILRDIVRNSLNEVASTYVVEDIYGEGKADFLHKVQAMIE